MYDVTLYRVKSPAESKAPWDYYKPIGTLPAAEASPADGPPPARRACVDRPHW